MRDLLWAKLTREFPMKICYYGIRKNNRKGSLEMKSWDWGEKTKETLEPEGNSLLRDAKDGRLRTEQERHERERSGKVMHDTFDPTSAE